MAYSNPFVLPAEQYQRDLDIMGQYILQSSTYLSKMTGRSIESCREFVKKSVSPGGEFEFKDPRCIFLERGENGDRELKEGNIYQYIQSAINERDLIAPTFTTYLHPDKKKSLLVDFIDANVKARGVAKKEMFAAEQAGDMLLYAIKKNEQGNRKLANNSISGAHVSASQPLYNRSAHSTLTSNCRSTSGYGNANNEKLLSGNRHYYSPDVVRNNITSIITNTDLNLIADVVAKYNLHIPTYSDVMECITYSTNLYWTTELKGCSTNTGPLTQIKRYVSTLTDMERAAFVYVGDIYHLKKHNDAFVRKFIGSLATRVPGIHPDPESVFKNTSEDIHFLAIQICAQHTKGNTLKELKDKNPTAYAEIAMTVDNIKNVVEEYTDLIKALWVTKNVPASLGYFPQSIRRSALTSDTDSTIFTVQDWVVWYQGDYRFTDTAYSVAAVMIFLAAQTIIHVLARMSANFGIENKRIHQIAMKNEFKFDVFVPTQVAKHYYAFISCQEGKVYKDFKTEIKGVHLKSSNVAKEIIKRAENMMESVMMSVVEGRKLNARKLMSEVAYVEHDLIRRILSGDSSLFKRGLIKTPASYIDKENAAPYQQSVLWDSVFSEEYGVAPPLPYMSIKISVGLDSPAKTEAWLAGINNPEFVDRVRKYMSSRGKRHIGSTFQLPLQNVVSKGIPLELSSVMQVRDIVLDNCKVFYLLLASLGIYVLNKHGSRMVSDEISFEEASAWEAERLAVK